MSVISVDKNPDDLTMVVVADFDAPVEKVWNLWADPRMLERWWGPPTYPATFEAHDLSPSGEVSYFMTGPEGDRSRGWWRIEAVNPPKSLEFVDGFANPDGTPIANMPTTKMRMQLTDRNGGTRMELQASFASKADMDQLLGMGMDEGLKQSVGQMDGLLAA